MATRKIQDAQDTTTNELIYFKGHAKATYMSDGRNVEEAIRQIGTGGGGGDSLWQEDTEGRAFCDKDIHVDGNISTSSTFIIGSIGVPLSEGYSTGDKGEILRANGDGSIGWDDLSIPTKVSQLENDNVYFTDFKVTDLTRLNEGEIEELRIDPVALSEAIIAKKTILVPHSDGFVGGYGLLLGEVEGTNIYFSIYTYVGQYVYAEVYDGVVFADSMIIRYLDMDCVQQTQTNELTHIAIANAMMTTGGNIFALPSDATGDEDDILLSRDSVKTINGQSIFGSGNIEISGGEGGGSASDGRKEVIYVDQESTITSMRPNVIYWIVGFGDISIESFEEPVYGVDTYDVFTAIIEFEYYNDTVSLTLPDYVQWANGVIPGIVDGAQELSISRISDGDYTKYYAVLTPFKPV